MVLENAKNEEDIIRKMQVEREREAVKQTLAAKRLIERKQAMIAEEERLEME